MVKKTSSIEVVHAPAQVAAVVQAPAQLPQPLENYLAASTAGRRLTEVSTEEDAWQMVSMGQQMEAQGAIVRGYAMRHLQRTLPPMKFSAALAERNIARRTAYGWMESFDLFARFGELGVVPELAQLGVTKAIALRSWTDEQIKGFAAGQAVNGLTLDQAAEMSTRELDELQRQWKTDNDDELRKANAKVADLETKLETERNERKKLARASSYADSDEELPPFARAVRAESMVLTESIGFSIEHITAIADANLFAEVKHPERFKFQPIAAGTMYYALASNAARILALLKRLEGEFGKAITGGLHLDHQLTPAELAEFRIARDRLQADLKRDAENRAIQRENSTPGKRGRRLGQKQ